MHNKKLLIIIISTIFAIILSLAGLVVWGVNSLSQNKALTTKIIRYQIDRLLDLDSSVENPKAYIDWDLQYKISADKLIFINNKKNLVSVDNIHLNVFIPYLLLRKIYITEMTGDNLFMDVERWENNKINIIEIFNITGFFKIYFKNSSISVNKYMFKFTDKYHKPCEVMYITGNNILFSKFTLKKYFQLIMDGNVAYNKTSTPFSISFNAKIPKIKTDYNFEIILSDFNTNVFKTYLKEFFKDINFSTKGKLYLKVNSGKFFTLDTTLNGIKFSAENYPYSFDYKDTFSIKSKLSYDKKDVMIENLNVSGKDFDVLTSGKIFDIKKRPLDIDLFVKVKENSNGNSILKLVPSGINILNHAIDKAKKYNAGGIIGGQAHIKGKIGHLIVHGKVNGKRLNLGYGYNYPNSTVALDFQGEKMYIDALYYSNHKLSDFTTLTGNIKITKPFFLDLHAKTSSNLDLVSGHKALKICSDIFHFPLGPVSTFNILSGSGQADLKIKGTPPHVFLNGKMKFRNSNGAYEGFYGTVSNASGEIDFNGNEIVYNNIKGSQNGTIGYVSGKTEIHNNALTHIYLKVPSVPMPQAKVYIDNSPMLLQVSRGLKSIKNPDGIGDLTMTMVSSKDVQPYVEGTFKVKDGSCNLDKIAYRATNVNGKVDFTSAQSNIDFDGIMYDTYVILKGYARPYYSDLIITIPETDIQKVQDFITTSPMFSKMNNGSNLKDFSDFKGKIKAVTRLNGNFATDEIGFSTEVDIIEGQVKYLDIPDTINMDGGHISVSKDKILINNLHGTVLDTPYKFGGIVTDIGSSSEKTNLKFEMKGLTIEQIKKLIGSKIFTNEVNEFLSDFEYKSGMVDVVSYINNKQINADINFNNATVCYKPSGEMINIKSGKFFFSDNILKLNNLDISMENSQALIDGVIKNYKDDPYADIDITSIFDEKDFNGTIAKMLKLPVLLTGKIYMNMNMVGILSDWQIKARTMLDDAAYITYKGANIGADLSKYMFADIVGINDDIVINEINIYPMGSQYVEYKDDILAEIHGKINNIHSQNPTFENLKIKLYDYMNLSFLNIIFYENNNKVPLIKEGHVKGNVTLNDSITNPTVIGAAEVKNAILPSIATTVEDLFIEFNKNVIKIKDSIFNIAGSKADVTAILDNQYIAPITIKEISIKSQYINADNILSTFTALFANKETNKTENKHKNKNITEQELTLPVIIQKGNFATDNLIYNGLAINNAFADFTIDKDWNCNINNISAEVTSGKIYGDVWYNLHTTDLSGNIAAEQVMANAFASTFMNLPNEISGKMDLNIKFSTTGKDHDDMIKNLNGFSSFRLNNGRMLRLGSIEYMLRIANTFKGGLTRLNLNAVVNLVAPRTGYFDTIAGDLQIKKGTIITDRVTFGSKELNLFLTGSYNMTNSNVHGVIIGQMPMESKESILWLGSLGKISLNSLVRKLTREASEKDNENPFLTNPLEYINTIPGFKGNKGLYRFFVINLKGNLYTDKYVESFKWIK